MSISTHRLNGAIGALLDEYEKALNELKGVIQHIDGRNLMATVDSETDDEHCRSIQTILRHVVSSGYNYVIAIRQWLGEEMPYRKVALLPSISSYEKALDQMFAFNEQLFMDYPELRLEEYDPDKKINVRWGQQYDVEQLFEHAIVHVLKHRRQIERFKLILQEQNLR